MKPLTTREVSCLQWAAQGKTSWEVGMILGLSERTVNFHIHNACRKLNVHSRQAAIALALQTGLLSLPRVAVPRRSETRRLPVQETRPERP